MPRPRNRQTPRTGDEVTAAQNGPEPRQLTNDERFVWGECPVCHAKHGEKCHPEVGFALGVSISGGRPTEGAHLGRLSLAPERVREVPA